MSLAERGPPPDRDPLHNYYAFPTTTPADWLRLALLLFADDVGTPAVSAGLLQWTLDGVQLWSARRDLHISPKSTAMVFASGTGAPPTPPLHVGLPDPLPWVQESRYLGVPFRILSHQAPTYAPLLDTANVSYHLLQLSDLFTGLRGVRFTNPGVYTSTIHQIVLSRALFAAPVMPIATQQLDVLLNKAARSPFRLPLDYNTVLLRTELNLLPMHYLVCVRRLRYALSFFRCPFFTDFLAPLLDSGPLDAGAGGARYLYTTARLGLPSLIL